MSKRAPTLLAATLCLFAFNCGGQTEVDSEDDPADSDSTPSDGDGDAAISTGGSAGFGGTGGGTGEGAVTSSGGLTGDGDGGDSGGEGGGSGGRTENPVCNSVGERPGVAAIFDRAASTEAASDNALFFDFPWPELSRPAAELAKLPNPRSASGCMADAGSELAVLLTDSIDPIEYRQYLFELAGRSSPEKARHPVIYFRFDGGINEANLPSAAQSLEPKPPVFLLNVDPNSSKVGSAVPIESRVFRDSLYVPDNTLAVMPAVGFPLDPSTRYALVVLGDLGDTSGTKLGASAEFLSMIAGPECESSNPNYVEALRILEEQRGVTDDELAAMTVFETGAPTSAMTRILAQIDGREDAITLAAIDLAAGGPEAGGDSFVIQEGTFNTLIQQKGAPPYLPDLTLNVLSQSVAVTFDSSNSSGSFISTEIAANDSTRGTDEARLERIPFVLTLPTGPLESTNDDLVLPLVVYGTGTGGSRHTPRDNGVAEMLAQAGYAVLTVDPVMHASRSHSENIDPDLMSQLQGADNLLGTNYATQLTALVESGDLFFNPFQLEAARGNTLQGAVDYAWQAKVFSKAKFSFDLNGSTREVSFSHLSFFGHSQGGSIGPLLAGTNGFVQTLLSGASGHIPSVLLNKTKPSDTVAIRPMLDTIACDSVSLDAFHPVMSTVGYFLEAADGELYMETLTRPGIGPSLFLVQGIDDHYSPPLGNEALSSAGALHEVTTMDTPGAPGLQGQELLALLNPNGGYSAPLVSAEGNEGGDTRGFARYSGAGCSDAHFVFVCNEEAIGDWSTFFLSGLEGAPIIQ